MLNEKSIFASLRQAAFSKGDSTAVSHCGRSLTFGELYRTVDAVAFLLRELGIRQGDRVIVQAPRNIKTLLIILSLLKLRASYIPISEKDCSKIGLIQKIMNESEARYMVQLCAGLAWADISDLKVINQDILFANDSAEDAKLSTNEKVTYCGDLDDEVYVIYTSGSTGSPKGVSVSQESLVNYLEFSKRQYSENRVLTGAILCTAFTFDATVTTLFLPLLIGLKIEIVDESSQFEALADMLSEPRESYLIKITPSHLEALSHSPLLIGNLQNRHVFIVGGEVFGSKLAHFLVQRFPASEFYNEYGPTEATVGCMYYKVPQTRNASDNIPIGYPIAGAGILILDEVGNEVIGEEAGELYLYGKCLSNGYIGSDTGRRFQILDAFPHLGKTYKTGDVLRRSYSNDGEVVYLYLGRKDDEVKVRGHRINLLKVASVLEQCPEIDSAHVVLCNYGSGSFIRAFIKPTTPPDDSVSARILIKVCIEHARLNLSDFEVPSDIQLVESFPLTAHGKIDTLSLSERPAAKVSEVENIEFCNDAEIKLYAVLKDLLKTEYIDLETDLFMQGLNSISATKMVAYVRDKYNYDISINSVFERRTIRDIAKLIALEPQLPVKKLSRTLSRITRRSDLSELVCSSSQKRIWLASRLAGFADPYLMKGVFSLPSDYDPNFLKEAHAHLLARHIVLVSNFDPDTGEVMLNPAWAEKKFFSFEDLTGLSMYEQSSRYEEFKGRWRSEGLDLADDVLFRLHVIKVNVPSSGSITDESQETSSAKFEYLVHFTTHHIVVDGWSQKILFDDLRAIYENMVGVQRHLAPLAIDYFDYSASQKKLRESAQFQSGLEYWKTKLQGCPVVHGIPLDYGRPKVKSSNGLIYPTLIDSTISRRIKELAIAEGVSPFSIFHCAFAVLISCFGSDNDVIVGSPVTGREDLGTHDLVGMFVNTVVVRIAVDHRESFAQLLLNCESEIRESIRHQFVPFDDVVAQINPDRSNSYSPLVQITLAYQNNDKAEYGLAGARNLWMYPDNIHTETLSREDIELHLVENSEGNIRALWIYNSDLFSCARIETFARTFQSILRRGTHDPSQKISGILRPPEDELKMLREIGKGLSESNTGEFSVELRIRDCAKSLPAKVCLIRGTSSVTYSGLLKQADLLSHRMRSAGVKENSIVAVYVNDPIANVIACFAVMLYGAAYLPVSNNVPTKRREFMYKDSGAEFEISGRFSVPASADNDYTQQLTVHRIPCQYSPNAATSLRSNLAYCIFTSGSTGFPKGVKVKRSSFTNLIAWYVRYYSIDEQTVNLVFTSPDFDLTQKNLWATLAVGGSIVFPEFERFDPKEVCGLIAKKRVTLINCTPSQFDLISKVPAWDSLTHYPRYILLGGELLNSDLVKRAFIKDIRVDNMYGPTECTDIVSVHGVTESDRGVIPIGVPINNVEALILDEAFELQPIGAVGELCVSGDCLMDGYCGDNSSSLHSTEWGSVYRTGDLARWTYDESSEKYVLTCLGRVDNQIKLNGYRCDLSEIEYVLSSHPLVQRAVVVVAENEDTTSLSAFLQLEHLAVIKEYGSEEARSIQQWGAVFDKTYENGADNAGWISSIDGRSYAEEEMESWATEALSKIEFNENFSVLEVGVGTGLLLKQYIGTVKHITVTDISQSALDHIKSRFVADPDTEIELMQGDLAELVHKFTRKFDVCIVNSVTQYFPSPGYLDGILEALHGLCKDNSTILLGDIINYDFQEAILLERFLSRSKSDYEPVETASYIVSVQKDEIEELNIGPGYFIDYYKDAGCTSLSFTLKKNIFSNEMNRFRYDLLIEKGSHKRDPVQDIEFRQWQGFDDLEQALCSEKTDIIKYHSLPNFNNSSALNVQDVISLSNAGTRLCEAFYGAMRSNHIEMFNQLCSQYGWSYDLTYSGLASKNLAIYFHRSGRPAISPYLMGSHGVSINNPFIGAIKSRVTSNIIKYCENVLPSYLIPSYYAVLNELPLMSSGKIDRKCLSKFRRGSAHRDDPPLGATEIAVARVFCQRLQLEYVGRRESLFAIGGNSIVAIRILYDLGSFFQMDLSPSLIFEKQSVQELSSYIEAENLSLRLDKVVIPDTKATRFEATHAQQRIWFVDQMAHGSASYNIHRCLEIVGRIDVEKLSHAIAETTRIHSMLSSYYRFEDGRLYCYLDAERNNVLRQVILPEEMSIQTEFLKSISQEEEARIFDLRLGPVIRYCVAVLPSKDGTKIEKVFLFITVHHIAIDGWSISILMRDILARYDALLAGDEPCVARVPGVDYSQYARYILSLRNKPAYVNSLSYFEKRLSNAPTLSSIFTEYTRPFQLGNSAHVVSFTMGSSQSAELKHACEAHKITPFLFMKAALAALIFRLGENNRVILGTTVSGRSKSEFDEIIGLFVNSLVIDVDLDGRDCFTEVLSKCQQSFASALDRAIVGFDSIVEKVNPQRTQSAHPIFQICFTMQNYSQPAKSSNNLTVSDVTSKRADYKSEFDLDIQVLENAGMYNFFWAFNKQLFSSEYSERIVMVYKTLVNTFLANPSCQIGSLDLTPSDVKTKMLNKSGSGGLAIEKVIQHCFLNGINQPAKIAVVDRANTISYEKLSQSALALGRWITDEGFAPGDVIAFASRQPAFGAIVSLGLLNVGMIYLPIDPDSPLERINWILRDSRAKMLITDDTDMLNQREFEDVRLIDFRILPKDNDSFPSAVTHCGIGVPDSKPAYIIYTSGSTGTPKGVVVSRKALALLVDSSLQSIPMSVDQVFLLGFMNHFDGAIEGLYKTLYVGATCAMYSVFLESLSLIEFARKHRCTMIDTTPSLIEAGVEQVHSYDDAGFAVECLVLGGERLNPKLIQRLRKTPGFLETSIYNAYGPTEGVVTTNLFKVSDPISDRIPIGKFIPHIGGIIIDKCGAQAAEGVWGELILFGEKLADGYVGSHQGGFFYYRVEEGAKEILAYRTGDVARWIDSRSDIIIEVKGRYDEQVKIRGYRIDLSEIEFALNSHPYVLESAVKIERSEEKDTRLSGFITLASNAYQSEPSLKDIKKSVDRYLRRTLPLQMVPNSLDIVEKFYVGQSGKIDKRRLVSTSEFDVEDIRKPESEFEILLTEIWSDVIGHPVESVTYNFFDLGGHSILAMKVCSKIDQALCIKMPLRAIFTYPTIEALASVLDSMISDNLMRYQNGNESAQPIRQSKVDPILFMKFEKVGGTSLSSSILFPYAQKHGLIYTNPKEEAYIDVDSETEVRYDVSFRHFPRYTAEKSQLWLERAMKDRRTIALFRDPIDRAISAYNHLRHDISISFDEYLHTRHEFNHQSNWCGFKPGDPNFISNTFTQVGITDRFNESMVLFGLALNIPIQDMLYIPQRRTNTKFLVRSDLSEDEICFLREKEYKDYALYELALQHVNSEIAKFSNWSDIIALYLAALDDFNHALWSARGSFNIGYSHHNIWSRYDNESKRVIGLEALV